MKELSMRIVADPSAPRASRAKAAELRPYVGSRFDDLRLIVSELVTNSVRHGAGTGEVQLWIGVSQDHIRLEVTDRGPGFEMDEPNDGLGLHIVDQLADNWGVVVGDACTVWAELTNDPKPVER